MIARHQRRNRARIVVIDGYYKLPEGAGAVGRVCVGSRMGGRMVGHPPIVSPTGPARLHRPVRTERS
jgi:hypothetical protein